MSLPVQPGTIGGRCLRAEEVAILGVPRLLATARLGTLFRQRQAELLSVGPGSLHPRGALHQQRISRLSQRVLAGVREALPVRADRVRPLLEALFGLRSLPGVGVRQVVAGAGVPLELAVAQRGEDEAAIRLGRGLSARAGERLGAGVRRAAPAAPRRPR